MRRCAHRRCDESKPRLGELTLRRDDLKSQRDDLASWLDEGTRGQPAVRVCDDVVCFRVILCDTTRGVS